MLVEFSWFGGHWRFGPSFPYHRFRGALIIYDYCETERELLNSLISRLDRSWLVEICSIVERIHGRLKSTSPGTLCNWYASLLLSLSQSPNPFVFLLLVCWAVFTCWEMWEYMQKDRILEWNQEFTWTKSHTLVFIQSHSLIFIYTGVLSCLVLFKQWQVLIKSLWFINVVWTNSPSWCYSVECLYSDPN